MIARSALQCSLSRLTYGLSKLTFVVTVIGCPNTPSGTPDEETQGWFHAVSPVSCRSDALGNLYSRTRQSQSALVLINTRNSAVQRDSSRSRPQRTNTRDPLRRKIPDASSLRKHSRVFSGISPREVRNTTRRDIGKHYSDDMRTGQQSAAN